MSTPGASTSGFMPSDIGDGPLEEKLAISSAGPSSPSVDAATVIASGAVPGEPTEPRPLESKSLPAAITGTTPASAASSIACTTMSRVGSISGSPSERLMTSMPSVTAASIAGDDLRRVPVEAEPAVGTVSTL